MKAFSLTLLFTAALTKADYAARQVGKLEEMYVEDCDKDSSPHGYYGAFLEPCEFTFYASTDDLSLCDAKDMIGIHMPLNWVLNLTEHYKNEDWDQFSSDDMPDPQKDLLLWPDQCVAVMPRCYPVSDFEPILSNLIQDGIPMDATHVRVDCRADGLAVSKTVYAIADGFEKSALTLALWAITLFVVFACSLMWCCLGCFRLCRGPVRPPPARQYGVIHAHPAMATTTAPAYSYVELEQPSGEEARLLKK